jgi:hypothetical protein
LSGRPRGFVDVRSLADLQALARERNQPLDVLSTGTNDPFRCGTPGHVAQAEWFARLWEEHGFGHGVHLRRIHYRLVSTSALTAVGTHTRTRKSNGMSLWRPPRRLGTST